MELFCVSKALLSNTEFIQSLYQRFAAIYIGRAVEGAINQCSYHVPCQYPVFTGKIDD